MTRARARYSTLRTLLLSATAVFYLSACTHVIPYPKVQTPPEAGRVTFSQDESVLELEDDAQSLFSFDTDKGDPLPGNLIGPIKATNMPLEDFLLLVTRDNKIPYTLGTGAEQAKVSLVVPDKLPLAKLIDLAANQAGLFYQYKDGILNMDAERSFTVRIPNVLEQNKYKDLTQQDYESSDDSSGDGEGGGSSSSGSNQAQKASNPDDNFSTIDAFAKSFTDQGATNVSPNKRTGLISFSVSYANYKNVADFMRKFEENRTLIIYDAWIYEVQLSDAKQAGINWNDFSKAFGGTNVSLTSGIGTTAAAGSGSSSSSTSSSGTSGSGDSSSGSVADAVSNVHLPSAGEALRGAGGLTLGVLGTPGAWAIDTMFQFLNNQGSAKTLAQPTLSVVGGEEANVFVGESLKYIDRLKVDTNNNNNNSSSSDSSDNTSTDVKTKRLKTGIELGITGDITNGVVESNIGLSFVELLSLNNVNVKGWTLQLPRTAERSLQTKIRCRPGDVIMLGGLIYDRGTRNQDNLMVGNVPLGAQAEGNRNELVMMLRPRLVKFVPSKKQAQKAYGDHPLVIGPVVPIKHDTTADTNVVTPQPPEDVQMKKSSTSERDVIDGIKADPTASNLATDARDALSQIVPAPLQQPILPAPAPAPTTPQPKPAAPATQPQKN